MSGRGEHEGARTGAGRARQGGRAGRRALRLALTATLAGLLIALACSASAQALTISPLNGTPDASPQTQISFLGIAAAQIADIRVVGSRSGDHTGRLRAYASAAGASFLPSRGFSPGESVRVSAVVGKGASRRRVGTFFVVARPAPWAFRTPTASGSAPAPGPGAVQSFYSQPSLHPPSVQVTASSPQATPGDIFLAPAHGPGQHGPMIIDGEGRLVWFSQAPPGTLAMDLQVEQYEGRPVLAWWQGRILGLGVGLGVDEIYGSNYRPLARISAGNGYQADLHELQITPEGSAYITAYTPVYADLSGAGGSRHGILLDSIVQEVDIKTGLVMFEWHAFSRVPIWDSYTAPSAGEAWDYFHINSISPDPRGNGDLLVSSRNTWAGYEISKHTGAIEWRIGGRRSTFHMGPGTGIAWQHDIRWQPDHTLTIFDDGALPKVHSQSRAIRERIDWRHLTVTLVGRYTHAPALLAGSQGDAQALAGGGSFVGWGEAPYLTEYSLGGQVLFDAHLPATVQSYRAYRFSWEGRPATAPSIAVSAPANGTVTVYASWNGATAVHAWRVLGEQGTGPGGQLATATATGFETAIPVPAGDPAYAVQALAADGTVLGTSRPAPAG